MIHHHTTFTYTFNFPKHRFSCSELLGHSTIIAVNFQTIHPYNIQNGMNIISITCNTIIIVQQICKYLLKSQF